ncbi:unnamed protein product, partial [Polarella glacialis]
AAAAAWAELELVARGRASARDSLQAEGTLVSRLEAAHPHPEASGALAWLYLFGVPRSAQALGLPRDVDKAVAIAREAVAQLQETPCGRCYALLGLLLSVGYPPLVGAAHVTVDGSGRPALLFVGGRVQAREAGSADSARLPRDIGRPDPAAAAYTLAAEAGDALGVLAIAYLTREGLVDAESLRAPGPNQASSITPRRPKRRGAAVCDPLFTSLLGTLAGEAVDAMRDGESWGPVPSSLADSDAAARRTAANKAWLQHVLSDAQGASASDLARAAEVLEAGEVVPEELPRTAGAASSPIELRALAASKGDRSSALRAAVEHLQHNDSAKAKPLLKLAAAPLEGQASLGGSDEADTEMARYYLGRFAGGDTPEEELEAWPHLVRAADLGRADAQLLVAHVHASGGGLAGAPLAAPNSSEAMRRYRQLAAPSVAAPTEQAAAGPSAALSEVQAFAAYNLGVLSLQEAAADAKKDSGDSEADSSLADSGKEGCTEEAQQSFLEVALSQLPVIRLALALERRAARLGDELGALLFASLLSDLGHPVGHADAAYFWDGWAGRGHRPAHLGSGGWEATAEQQSSGPCDLQGWWTSSSSELAAHNVSRAYATAVEGGGFEMFNASLEAGAAGLAGLSAASVVLPSPTTSQFRHLHSFLWHTTYDVLPDGAPVPIALQPPGAVPHLIEHQHQRGKLLLDKTCNVARVEGMWVNWTFHRLDANVSSRPADDYAEEAAEATSSAKGPAAGDLVAARDFLNCWVRPERYYASLDANIAASQKSPKTTPAQGTWEELMSLTSSRDPCLCHGGFGCRRMGDGACEVVAEPWAAAGEESKACARGAALCREVPLDLEPSDRPTFAAAPEVCGLAFHRRASGAGRVDSMHVLSHAYSNGHRGAPKDAAEALVWSQRAMDAGDARGRFDVAYSLEFGLGVEANPTLAYAMYKELLSSQGSESGDGAPMAARASSLLALLSASGRYLASRLLGTSDRQPPFANPW